MMPVEFEFDNEHENTLKDDFGSNHGRGCASALAARALISQCVLQYFFSTPLHLQCYIYYTVQWWRALGRLLSFLVSLSLSLSL